jgi:hypothetical protein
VRGRAKAKSRRARKKSERRPKTSADKNTIHVRRASIQSLMLWFGLPLADRPFQ